MQTEPCHLSRPLADDVTAIRAIGPKERCDLTVQVRNSLRRVAIARNELRQIITQCVLNLFPASSAGPRAGFAERSKLGTKQLLVLSRSVLLLAVIALDPLSARQRLEHTPQRRWISVARRVFNLMFAGGESHELLCFLPSRGVSRYGKQPSPQFGLARYFGERQLAIGPLKMFVLG